MEQFKARNKEILIITLIMKVREESQSAAVITLQFPGLANGHFWPYLLITALHLLH